MEQYEQQGDEYTGHNELPTLSGIAKFFGKKFEQIIQTVIVVIVIIVIILGIVICKKTRHGVPQGGFWAQYS